MNQRPKIRAHQLRYLTLTVFIIGCMAKDTGDIDEIVAVVNGDSITRRDFILRIEMTILPGNDRWADRNERLLNIMIDELVVGQWAEQEGFELPPAYDEQLQFITQQASIRELYRLEFENLPEVDSVLIVQAVEKSSTELSIQTMFTESEGISMDWQEATNQGQTFSELLTGGSQNPAIHIGQSTIRWGDGDVPEKIEALAYSMEIDEVSEVVAINDGFVIFKITGFEKEMIMTESGYSAKWLAVKKQLRSRQVDREARKYIAAMMTTKNIIQRAAGFQEVSGYLEKQLRDNPSRSEANALGEMDETSFLPDFDLALPAVETPDFTWTGEDVLLLVRNYNYRLPANDPDALRSNLTWFLKGATRDHYLNERAMRRGIASNARVKNDTRMWTRHFLFRIGIREMWGQRADSSTVANKIAQLRESAQIRVNQEVLEKIELTNIAVLAYWSTDIARHLAVPPLIDIQ